MEAGAWRVAGRRGRAPPSTTPPTLKRSDVIHLAWLKCVFVALTRSHFDDECAEPHRCRASSPTIADLQRGEPRADASVPKDGACLWRSATASLVMAARRDAFARNDLSSDELARLNQLFTLVTSVDAWGDDGVSQTQNALQSLLGSVKDLCLDIALECCRRRGDDDAARSEIVRQQHRGTFSSKWPDVFMVCDLFEHLGLGLIVGVWHPETRTCEWECRCASHDGGHACVIYHFGNHFGYPALVSSEESDRVRARARTCPRPQPEPRFGVCVVF